MCSCGFVMLYCLVRLYTVAETDRSLLRFAFHVETDVIKVSVDVYYVLHYTDLLFEGLNTC